MKKIISIFLVVITIFNVLSYSVTSCRSITYREEKFDYNTYTSNNLTLGIENDNIIVGNTEQIIVAYNGIIDTVLYTSSNPNIAIVSDNGVIMGVKPGVCYIIVNINNSDTEKIKIVITQNNSTKNDQININENTSTNNSISETISTTESTNSNTNTNTKSPTTKKNYSNYQKLKYKKRC